SQAGRDDFIPAAVEEQEGRKIIQPLLGKSGLMSILSRAHGFIHIPYEKQGMKAGEKLEVIIY
ncbi:MAG: molybdopterin molybdenumtransferase MoeA, partial [Syntrophomonadaceae bacterium]|nr:molybdopterin molybdenumtransferase MoeA [Syntrophomonadaceae bacterium]